MPGLEAGRGRHFRALGRNSFGALIRFPAERPGFEQPSAWYVR
jgi:hypothetical protein